MKQKILELLQTKFNGVDAKILGRLAEKLSKDVNTEEEAQTAADGVSFAQVLEFYGDSRATDAQKTAVANYEKKHGLKDGKPATAGTSQQQQQAGGEQQEDGVQQKPADEMPAWAKTLLESNKQLQDKISAMEGEKVTTNRKAQLANVLKNAPAKIRDRYEKDFARLHFENDDDFTGWIGEITPEIESITAEFATKGGIVSRPMSGSKTGQQDGVNPIVKALYEKRAQEQPVQAIQGIPTTGAAAGK